MCACSEGHHDVVEMLLQAGANIEAKDQGGWKALMCACSKGDYN
eukprot:gene26946-biopygen17521